MERDHQFSTTRCGLTRTIDCGIDVYLTVNPRPDGEPGEVFVKCGKEGTTVSGLVQAWVVAISTALKRGVSWDDLRGKFIGMRFDPRTAEYSSIIDAVARNIDDLRDECRRSIREQGAEYAPVLTDRK